MLGKGILWMNVIRHRPGTVKHTSILGFRPFPRIRQILIVCFSSERVRLVDLSSRWKVFLQFLIDHSPPHFIFHSILQLCVHFAWFLSIYCKQNSDSWSDFKSSGFLGRTNVCIRVHFHVIVVGCNVVIIILPFLLWFPVCQLVVILRCCSSKKRNLQTSGGKWFLWAARLEILFFSFSSSEFAVSVSTFWQSMPFLGELVWRADVFFSVFVN